MTIKRRLAKLKRVPIAVEGDVIVALAIGVNDRLAMDECNLPEDFVVAARYPQMVVIFITGWIGHEDVRAAMPILHPGNQHLQSSLSLSCTLKL